MAVSIKAVIRYLALLGITAALLWLSLRNIKGEEGQSRLDFILEVWHSANGALLLLSGAIGILSHYLRAVRWKLLLHPLGHPTHTFNSFLSVMVGYFVNLAIPRGGELSRCYNLYKLDHTPVNESFGTVVAERVIDLLFLLTMIGLALTVEWAHLLLVFEEIKPLLLGDEPRVSWIALGIALGLVGICLAALVWGLRAQSTRMISLREKVVSFLVGLRNGLLVVFRLRKKGLFIFYSLGIWVLYFLMSYTVLLAFPETSSLGLAAALSIFVIGGIAMALPLPGGAGSYHVLVPLGLVMLYQIKEDQAVAFTVIFHGWQTLLLILFGVISLIISQSKYNSRQNL
jgi:glycosyltransferase 2 family protein